MFLPEKNTSIIFLRTFFGFQTPWELFSSSLRERLYQDFNDMESISVTSFNIILKQVLRRRVAFNDSRMLEAF